MTVLQHFGLREQPFGVTPDPRFLYATSTHREALASLLYGLESGLGFVSLIALPGMGKTTLLFEALRRVADSTRSVFLFQTISNPNELVHSLLVDLGEKDVTGNLVEMQSRLNEVLVNHRATGKRLVVVIDEAQNLNTVVLESVRMLSNFETAGQKLLQIVLAGQPQLAEKLVSPELLQLRQRISIFAHLDPLVATETSAYVQHRLRIAGCDLPETVFTKAALASISRASDGIPRNINNICFNALSIGFALQKRSIDADVVDEVLRDLDIKLDYALPAKVSAPQPALFKEITGARTTGLSRLSIWALCLAAVACAVLSLLVGIGIGGLRERMTAGGIKQELSGLRQPGSSTPAAAPPGQQPEIATPATSPAAIPPVSASPATVPPPVTATEQPTEQPKSTTATVPAVSRGTAETQLIRARNGQTMSSICKEMFGKCTADVFRQMVQLNPEITNPDRISLGQKIVIPVPPS